MRWFWRRLLRSASDPASAYTTLFAFGDSISDAGNFAIMSPELAPLPPYYGGRFSNGPTWVEDLSTRLGLGALKPALSGGADYAIGGARTTNLLAQIDYYAQSHPKPVPGALYTLDIGGGDIIDALASYSAGKITPSQASTRPSCRRKPPPSTMSICSMDWARATFFSTKCRIWACSPECTDR